jgi:hypothetical protein
MLYTPGPKAKVEFQTFTKSGRSIDSSSAPVASVFTELIRRAAARDEEARKHIARQMQPRELEKPVETKIAEQRKDIGEQSARVAIEEFSAKK